MTDLNQSLEPLDSKKSANCISPKFQEASAEERRKKKKKKKKKGVTNIRPKSILHVQQRKKL
jgi:hypothetical protein